MQVIPHILTHFSLAWSFCCIRAPGSHLLPHRTIGRYRTVASDLWRSGVTTSEAP